WKRSEVFSFHFLQSQRSTDLLHFTDVIYRIDLLDVPSVDVFQAERIQTFTRKLDIIASISEQLWHIRNTLPDHVVNFAVQQISSQAFSENAAQKILLVQRCSHECGGNRARIVEQVHLFRTQIIIRIGTRAGAD